MKKYIIIVQRSVAYLRHQADQWLGGFLYAILGFEISDAIVSTIAKPSHSHVRRDE